MSEQKVSNERKKELTQIDPFQAGLLKAISYSKAYKKQLILIAGAFVLAAVVFVSVIYSFKKTENSASELVSQALVKYSKIDDPQKGYVEIEKDFKTIFTDFPHTVAGKQALVQFAKICYDASKFDNSYQYYKEAFDAFKDEALMENFLLSSLGHVCIAKKDFVEARKYFIRIEEGKTDLLKDEAKFTLAMLEEADNNAIESKKMYGQIVAEFENSMYFPIAQSKIN